MTEQMTHDLKHSATFTDPKRIRRFLKCATFARINGRRADLIFRHGNVTDNERAELKILQDEVRRLVNSACPRPPLFNDILLKLEEEFLAE